MKSQTLILVAVLLCFEATLLVNAQYFSAADGVTIGRLGKRTYLSDLLRLNTPYPSEERQNLVPSDYYQTDKFATRRWNKFGKRTLGNEYLDQVDEGDEESYLNELLYLALSNNLSRDVVTKELVNKNNLDKAQSTIEKLLLRLIQYRNSLNNNNRNEVAK